MSIQIDVMPTVIKRLLGSPLANTASFISNGTQMAALHTRSEELLRRGESPIGEACKVTVLEVVLSPSAWLFEIPNHLRLELVELEYGSEEDESHYPFRVTILDPPGLASKSPEGYLVPPFGRFGPAARPKRGEFLVLAPSGAGCGWRNLRGVELCRGVDAWRDSDISRGIRSHIFGSPKSSIEEALALILFMPLYRIYGSLAPTFEDSVRRLTA